jgi:hypothetical protein
MQFALPADSDLPGEFKPERRMPFEFWRILRESRHVFFAFELDVL